MSTRLSYPKLLFRPPARDIFYRTIQEWGREGVEDETVPRQNTAAADEVEEKKRLGELKVEETLVSCIWISSVWVIIWFCASLWKYISNFSFLSYRIHLAKNG